MFRPDQVDAATAAVPVHIAASGSRACLVEGCPCKDARIVSTRRAAFYASLARRRGETADRVVAPDPDWTWTLPTTGADA
jgi:hypothetical protein